MAGANLPAKKYKHSTPTQLRLVFQFLDGETGGYIDLAQALSAINRRFYRQGVYYYLNSMEVETLQDGYVEIGVAPDNWCVNQAWKRAFGKFQEMNAQSDTPRPKYHDFKVFLDSTHRDDINSGQQNKLPIGVGTLGNIDYFSSDEWQYSQFVSQQHRGTGITNPNQFNIHVIGDHVGSATAWDSIGMIESYMRTRPVSNTGGSPEQFSNQDEDPLNLLMEGSQVDAIEEISEHLNDLNDDVPYDRDHYPGTKDNHLIPLERLYTSGVPSGRTHKVSGACVPFGLMRVSSSGYTGGFRLILNVASGTYNGVYAERV